MNSKSFSSGKGANPRKNRKLAEQQSKDLQGRSMPEILRGIKVIDWSLFHVGPVAAAMLADAGADVIHVEERNGDPARGISRFYGQQLVVKDRNIIFEEFNRNKRSITLDIKKPEGLEVMYRLVEKSDIFLTNFRLNAIKRLGLDYDTLVKHNPKIIYAHSSTFGNRGPNRDRPGLEPITIASSGMMLSSGEEGMPPIVPTVGMGDRIGAIFLAYVTLLALLARERHGISQFVSSSALGGMLNLEAWSMVPVLFFGNDPPRQRRDSCPNPLNNFYLCKDGVWIQFALLQSDRHWPEFCRAIGIPELEKSEKYKSEDKRMENCVELISILDKRFATKTYHEWENILMKTDLLFNRVNKLTDVASDPQVVENNFIMDWDHSHWGKIKFPGFCYELSKTPPSIRREAPTLGQHTEEVLLELGYTWEDIANLKDKEVI
jgi:crotonobetainyl-CoA:carnitine CoA-transferase CaiB-like acyl-CoA transferase